MDTNFLIWVPLISRRSLITPNFKHFYSVFENQPYPEARLLLQQDTLQSGHTQGWYRLMFSLSRQSTRFESRHSPMSQSLTLAYSAARFRTCHLVIMKIDGPHAVISWEISLSARVAWLWIVGKCALSTIALSIPALVTLEFLLVHMQQL